MIAAPSTYSVHARARRSGRAEVDAAGETIAFDAGWASEPQGLPGPAELLAASFSACLLKNLERAGRLIGFRYEDATVEVTARRQDSPPRFVEIGYTMRISTDEPQRRLDLLHANLRKFGTVYNTLAAVCDVHGEVVAMAPSGAPKPSGHGAVP